MGKESLVEFKVTIYRVSATMWGGWEDRVTLLPPCTGMRLRQGCLPDPCYHENQIEFMIDAGGVSSIFAGGPR